MMMMMTLEKNEELCRLSKLIFMARITTRILMLVFEKNKNLLKPSASLDWTD